MGLRSALYVDGSYDIYISFIVSSPKLSTCVYIQLIRRRLPATL